MLGVEFGQPLRAQEHRAGVAEHGNAFQPRADVAADAAVGTIRANQIARPKRDLFPGLDVARDRRHAVRILRVRPDFPAEPQIDTMLCHRAVAQRRFHIELADIVRRLGRGPVMPDAFHGACAHGIRRVALEAANFLAVHRCHIDDVGAVIAGQPRRAHGVRAA